MALLYVASLYNACSCQSYKRKLNKRSPLPSALIVIGMIFIYMKNFAYSQLGDQFD